MKVLSDIAEIYLGIIQKRNEILIKNENTREYKIFSLKCYVEKLEYDTIYTDKDMTDNLTQKGDLLFRLVSPNRIIIIDENTEGLLVNNQFCIIRPTSFVNYRYDSNFLKWYLESDIAQKKLEKYLIGTAVRSVPVAKLRELEVPGITTKRMQEITNVIMKWNKQKDLYNEIISLKDRYYSKVISNIIEKGE